MVYNTDLKSVGVFPVWVRVPPAAFYIMLNKYFDVLDAETSYIFGFIVADGCLILKRIGKNNKPQYILNITNKDLSILKLIKKSLGASHKIGNKFNSTSNKKYYQIQIGDQKLCQNLIKLGVYPRKTFNLSHIKFPQKYFSDFVRGFFDGDGTVYIYKVNGVKQIKADFCCPNRTFLMKFSKILCKYLEIPIKNIHRYKEDSEKMEMYTIYFYIKDCKKLYDFMYNGSNLFLRRKKMIFEKWKKCRI